MNKWTLLKDFQNCRTFLWNAMQNTIYLVYIYTHLSIALHTIRTRATCITVVIFTIFSSGARYKVITWVWSAWVLHLYSTDVQKICQRVVSVTCKQVELDTHRIETTFRTYLVTLVKNIWKNLYCLFPTLIISLLETLYFAFHDLHSRNLKP